MNMYYQYVDAVLKVYLDKIEQSYCYHFIDKEDPGWFTFKKIQDGCGTEEIHYLDHITIWGNCIISLVNIFFYNKVLDDMFMFPQFENMVCGTTLV